MTVELKSPAALVIAIALVAALLSLWQVADEGLGYVKRQLRSQPALLTEVGVPTHVFAFRARYMDDAREYSVVIVGASGWTSRRLRVEYLGANPTSVALR